MSILISDQKLLDLIKKKAIEKKQTPDQIVTAAIVAYISTESTDGSDGFWNSIIGLGSSGDPTIAERDEEILAEDIDPIRGWGSTSDDADTNRH